MIDNFSVLKDYVIPRNVLLKLLEAYQDLGRSDIYLSKLGEVEVQIKKSTLENNTFYFIELLKKQGFVLDITENRLRLLITKNSDPKNNTEKIVFGIKKVIEMITEEAKVNKSYSSTLKYH